MIYLMFWILFGLINLLILSPLTYRINKIIAFNSFADYMVLIITGPIGSIVFALYFIIHSGIDKLYFKWYKKVAGIK